MVKKGGSKLLRAEAIQIAKKLGAEIKSGANHQHALVKWNNKIVTQFGIRNGRRSKHGHIPHSLYINEAKAYGLATCSVTAEQYFDLLKKKDLLPEE